MSGVITAVAISASAMAGMYQDKRAADRTDAASRRQEEAMRKAEQQQEQDYNRANQRKADVSGLLRQNTGGFGGANLTAGSAGVTGGMLGGGGMLGR